ncbi:TetR/AcrR family transcriptional regulator [Pseudomaricurvus alcaniphilus]|uniref:TetR/AcrR family transcriptional regulator n=1 Tax=Pseudomaricurvus alcaniphilus TaxID=1166482 RepID=UPI001A9D961A|nr:TetR/AcrR family transcriptional regulator [Pseudomaricurvus alcaniphilus]
MQSGDVFQGVGIDWLDDSEWVATPMQQRSRETMLKILKTAKTLFIEKGYQETSMAEICRVTGMSMGSIYHRFPDKKSIFYAILEMYRHSRFAQIASLTQPEDWRDRTAEEVLAFHIEIMFSTSRKDNGFIRLMERQRIVDPTMCQLLADWNEHVVNVIYGLMEPHAHRVQQEDLLQAIRYTHGILRGALMWSLLPPINPNSPLDTFSDEYKDATYAMAAAYLGLDSSVDG